MNIDEYSINGKDIRSELEQFLHRSQWYLNQTQQIKEELNEINRKDHADLYIRTLSKSNASQITSIGHFFYHILSRKTCHVKTMNFSYSKHDVCFI